MVVEGLGVGVWVLGETGVLFAVRRKSGDLNDCDVGPGWR